MCPARGINLPSGNAHGAQCGHGIRRFFSAAANGGAHARERWRCARVGGLVRHVLVAPMVHFEHGLIHGEPAHAVAEFGIARGAEGVQMLVVHTHGQHEMPPFAVGNLAAPRHLAAGAQGAFHLFDVELWRIVSHIGQGHIGIEELEGSTCLGRLGQGYGLSRLSHSGQLATGCEVAMYDVCGLRTQVVQGEKRKGQCGAKAETQEGDFHRMGMGITSCGIYMENTKPASRKRTSGSHRRLGLRRPWTKFLRCSFSCWRARLISCPSGYLRLQQPVPSKQWVHNLHLGRPMAFTSVSSLLNLSVVRFSWRRISSTIR